MSSEQLYKKRPGERDPDAVTQALVWGKDGQVEKS